MNLSSENLTILKMVICAGLYPNVAVHQVGFNFITHQTLVVRPSPSSIALSGDYTDPEAWKRLPEELVGSIFCYRNVFSSKSAMRKYYMADITPISPLLLALFSPNVKIHAKEHNQLLIDDSIPLKFSGDPNAAAVFLDFKKVWDTALLSAMQRIAETWGSDVQKSRKRGVIDIILGAAQELLKYEEGQAKRREGDVGKFALGVQQDVVDWENLKAELPSELWRPLSDKESDVDSVRCSVCGQAGHGTDDCSDQKTRYVTKEPAPESWDPEADAEREIRSDDDFDDLPSDMDYR
jgi:hypothetical protein